MKKLLSLAISVAAIVLLAGSYSPQEVQVPIGAVIGWHKTLTGVPALPSGYVECNGQTLSDSRSPLNGQAMPLMNTNHVFLRGGAGTSGSSGGAATHTHFYSGTTEVEDGDTDVQDNSGTPASVSALGHIHAYAGTTAAGSSLPPYLEVIWIIRIK